MQQHDASQCIIALGSRLLSGGPKENTRNDDALSFLWELYVLIVEIRGDNLCLKGTMRLQPHVLLPGEFYSLTCGIQHEKKASFVLFFSLESGITSLSSHL